MRRHSVPHGADQPSFWGTQANGWSTMQLVAKMAWQQFLRLAERPRGPLLRL